MGSKLQRVPKHQGMGFVDVENGATRGATVGVDLVDGSGNVIRLDQILNQEIPPASVGVSQADIDAAIAAHVADADPHPQYTTAAEATTIASSAINTHVLDPDPHPQYATDADVAGKQPLDATLTALAANDWVNNSIPVGNGVNTMTQLAVAANRFVARNSGGGLNAWPITDFALTLVDDVDAAAMKTTLGLVAIATSGSAADLTAGSIPAARIAAGTITNAMQANMAANTMSGNPTAAGAAPADMALAANQFFARSSAGNIAAKPITDTGLEFMQLAAKGTFVPTIIGTTTAGVGTYTLQSGKYTRVGDYYEWKIAITITAHTGTGNVRIAGLPFTSANDGIDNPANIGRVDNLTIPAGSYMLAANPANSSQVILYFQATGGGVSSGITLDTAFTIIVSGRSWL